MNLTHTQYEVLERAVARGERLAIRRPGRRELVVIPLALRIRDGREAIDARNPTTGDDMTIYVDDIEVLEAMP